MITSGSPPNVLPVPARTGSTASALVCGWTDLHEQLANRIATLESTEAAVLFPSGYAACSGTIATLAEAGDLILSDELNHASLIDGCRLSSRRKSSTHIAIIMQSSLSWPSDEPSLLAFGS